MACRTHMNVFFVAIFTLAGILLTSTRCLGFGGVGVAAGGVGVSAGHAGVSASVAATGTGVSAGVAATGTGAAPVSSGVAAGGTGTAGASAGVAATGTGTATVSSGVAASGAAGAVNASVGVAPSGSGTADASAGVAAGGTGTAGGTNATGAVNVSVGTGSVASGSGGISAGAAVSDGGSLGFNAGVSGAQLGSVAVAGRSPAPIAAPRAALQMGVGPFVPDRGMAQALGYDRAAAAAAAASIAADRVFSKAVNALPPLPGPSALAVSDQPAPLEPEPQQPTQQQDRAAQKLPAAPKLARPAAVRPHRPNRAAGAAPVTVRAAAVEHANPSLRREFGVSVTAPVNAVTAGDPSLTASAPRHALTVLLDPPGQLSSVRPSRAASQWQDGWGQQAGTDWNMVGRFSGLRASPFQTRLAALMVTLLAAISAYGWVRLMTQKCPRCMALLERHSAGCRKCGAVLNADHRGRA